MLQPNPNNSDAVLGGHMPPPVNAVVLGGVAGEKQKLARELGLPIELSRDYQLFSFETVRLKWWGKVDRIQKQALYYRENLDDNVSLDMVYIPAGSFLMGAPDDEEWSGAFERPQHLVKLPAFHMSKFPITQAQYRAVMMDFHSSRFIGDNLPVDSIDWIQAKTFCQHLAQKCGKSYTLPSESQWEYACRAGTTTPFYFGKTISTDVANYNGDYTYGYLPKGLNTAERKTTTVGLFPPNAFGLFDLHGNIWEWCEDNSHPYINAPTDGTAWINEDDLNSHILRGGCWYSPPQYCRSAARWEHRETIVEKDLLTPDGSDLTILMPQSQFFHYCGLRVVCA